MNELGKPSDEFYCRLGAGGSAFTGVSTPELNVYLN